MKTEDFQLVPALQKKDFICDLNFCRVLFEDNKNYPWIFLVPRKNNVKNMLGLTSEERSQLMKEIEQAEKVMNDLFQPAQLNTAAIGNITPQLHVHVICRFENDPAWPGTVWGTKGEPYSSAQKQEMVEKIRLKFNP